MPKMPKKLVPVEPEKDAEEKKYIIVELLKQRKPGRPSKLTDKTKEALFNAILGGNTIRDACAYAGINHSTYTIWMQKGLEDLKADRNTDYATFIIQTQEVLDMAKPRLVMSVAKGATNDPRLALTILERRYPKEWGIKASLDIRDRTGEPEEVSEDEFIRRLYESPEATAHIAALIDVIPTKPGVVGSEGLEGVVDATAPPQDSG
jgi:hypothetical protein